MIAIRITDPKASMTVGAAGTVAGMGDSSQWERFGVRLRDLRQAAGASQREAARAAAVSQAALSRIESGAQEPGVLALARLCAVLSVGVDELLDLRGGYHDALARAHARRLAVGVDDHGRPVGLRRDRARAGGPHSTFHGPHAHRLALRELRQRAGAGLRSVVLARDPKWRSPSLAHMFDCWAQPGEPVDPGSRLAIVLLSSEAGHGPRAATALVQAMAAQDVLVVVEQRAVREHPALADKVRAVMAHGRIYGCALNLLCVDDPPPWALANAGQVLDTADSAATLTALTPGKPPQRISLRVS